MLLLTAASFRSISGLYRISLLYTGLYPKHLHSGKASKILLRFKCTLPFQVFRYSDSNIFRLLLCKTLYHIFRFMYRVFLCFYWLYRQYKTKTFRPVAPNYVILFYIVRIFLNFQEWAIRSGIQKNATADFVLPKTNGCFHFLFIAHYGLFIEKYSLHGLKEALGRLKVKCFGG